MKITIYTITDCAFSKQEKEYLLAHGLQFEEKNLETNREFLTEMLAVGSNFAGTPVTKIEKDDGQIAVLKGFTAAEFDKTLGLAADAAPKAEPAKPTETTPPTPPAVEQPVVAAPNVPVTPEPVQPVVAAPAQAPVTTDPVMASLLNNLEQQAQTPAPAPVAPVASAPSAPATPQPGAPVIPDPQF